MDRPISAQPGLAGRGRAGYRPARWAGPTTPHSLGAEADGARGPRAGSGGQSAHVRAGSGPGPCGSDHALGADPLVELLGGEEGEGEGRLAQRRALLVRLLGDGRRPLVPDTSPPPNFSEVLDGNFLTPLRSLVLTLLKNLYQKSSVGTTRLKSSAV